LSHFACIGPAGQSIAGQFPGDFARQIVSTRFTHATFPDVLPHHPQQMYVPLDAKNVTAQSVSTVQLVSIGGSTMAASASSSPVSAVSTAASGAGVGGGGFGFVALGDDGSFAIEDGSSSRPRQPASTITTAHVDADLQRITLL
jgi:hypothetical protein